MEGEELLTVPEAAQRAGITQDGIRSAMIRGRLPFTEKYGRKLLRPADVDAYRATVKMGRPRKGQESEDTKQ